MIPKENSQIKELCISLMRADTEKEIIRILENHNLWNNDNLWRWYDDNENNWSQINAQTANADQAIVEKIINSIDARLINQCRCMEVDPEGGNAPKSIQEAVSKYFDNDFTNYNYFSGLISEWTKAKRTEVSRGITLACTGNKPSEGYPSFTIVDNGEGQTPNNFPKTFLSLSKTNKLKINFVQGKFNAGGSGVLPFCGENGFQLILSKRNPALIDVTGDDTNKNWGFTITRRYKPNDSRRSSVIKYLAPIGAKNSPNRGNVFSFDSNTFPIFPEKQNSYYRNSNYGTLIKLYEYQTKAKTHMFRNGGLLEKLDLLLPDVALPVRLHECRNYGGQTDRSFETTLTGIRTRIQDKKTIENVLALHTSSDINVEGENIKISIYAFNKNKAKTYKRSEGVLFTVNGQTHGILTHDYFRRSNGPNLSYIYKDLLLIADCSKISASAFEQLFKNSRDRFSKTPFFYKIRQELDYLLKNNSALKDYQIERQQQSISEKIGDSKPLEEILQNIFKNSPTLSNLFIEGNRIRNPFKPKSVGSQKVKYTGKIFPTYFRHKNKKANNHFNKNCHLNIRCRLFFETDATNDYLDRAIEPGQYYLKMKNNGQYKEISTYSMNLHNGIATLNLPPPSGCKIGDKFDFEMFVNDNNRIDPFKNTFSIVITDERIIDTKPGGSKRIKPPNDKTGNDRDISQGIDLPKIKKIDMSMSLYGDFDFNRESVLKLYKSTKTSGSSKIPKYDWYLNIDNIYFQTELKHSKVDHQIIESRFITGMTLIGLGILHDHFKNISSNADEEEDQTDEVMIEDTVYDVTKAIAPILLPMIDSLGGITDDIFSYN